ncbi:MAG: hypothetical protein II453_16760, partial [Alphaproteobacteria bacterium]|nr:hypothetical protein [Alphaproteobacteria bacterium]
MGKTDGRKWVDLGLPSGRKWAMCNIGAEDDEDDYLGMEEYGSYFAWGDVKGDPYAGSKQSGYRRSFDWGNYSLCNGSQD